MDDPRDLASLPEQRSRARRTASKQPCQKNVSLSIYVHIQDLLSQSLVTMMAATAPPQSNLKNDIRAALSKAGLSRIEKDVLGKCERTNET